MSSDPVSLTTTEKIYSKLLFRNSLELRVLAFFPAALVNPLQCTSQNVGCFLRLYFRGLSQFATFALLAELEHAICNSVKSLKYVHSKIDVFKTYAS